MNTPTEKEEESMREWLEHADKLKNQPFKDALNSLTQRQIDVLFYTDDIESPERKIMVYHRVSPLMRNSKRQTAFEAIIWTPLPLLEFPEQFAAAAQCALIKALSMATRKDLPDTDRYNALSNVSTLLVLKGEDALTEAEHLIERVHALNLRRILENYINERQKPSGHLFVLVRRAMLLLGLSEEQISEIRQTMRYVSLSLREMNSLLNIAVGKDAYYPMRNRHPINTEAAKAVRGLLYEYDAPGMPGGSQHFGDVFLNYYADNAEECYKETQFGDAEGMYFFAKGVEMERNRRRGRREAAAYLNITQNSSKREICDALAALPRWQG